MHSKKRSYSDRVNNAYSQTRLDLLLAFLLCHGPVMEPRSVVRTEDLIYHKFTISCKLSIIVHLDERMCWPAELSRNCGLESIMILDQRFHIKHSPTFRVPSILLFINSLRENRVNRLLSHSLQQNYFSRSFWIQAPEQSIKDYKSERVSFTAGTSIGKMLISFRRCVLPHFVGNKMSLPNESSLDKENNISQWALTCCKLACPGFFELPPLLGLALRPNPFLLADEKNIEMVLLVRTSSEQFSRFHCTTVISSP